MRGGEGERWQEIEMEREGGGESETERGGMSEGE